VGVHHFSSSRDRKVQEKALEVIFFIDEQSGDVVNVIAQEFFDDLESNAFTTPRLSQIAVEPVPSEKAYRVEYGFIEDVRFNGRINKEYQKYQMMLRYVGGAWESYGTWMIEKEWVN
jgi:hypothetical protein